MKKVRITTTNSKGKSFKIFSSPEAIYVWMNDPDMQDDDYMDPTVGNLVHLKKGEVMEVEWCGCEFVYENNSLLFRADYIRLGKLISEPTIFTEGKKIVGIQDGWITSDIIDFKSGTNELTKTTKLTSRSKHKFDLDELFSAREAYDEIEDEGPVGQKTLH
jgi:hypothetical protein